MPFFAGAESFFSAPFRLKPEHLPRQARDIPSQSCKKDGSAGGGYVGPQGVVLSSLKYDLEEQPRLKERLYYNDVWSR